MAGEPQVFVELLPGSFQEVVEVAPHHHRVRQRQRDNHVARRPDATVDDERHVTAALLAELLSGAVSRDERRQRCAASCLLPLGGAD